MCQREPNITLCMNNSVAEKLLERVSVEAFQHIMRSLGSRPLCLSCYIMSLLGLRHVVRAVSLTPTLHKQPADGRPSSQPANETAISLKVGGAQTRWGIAQFAPATCPHFDAQFARKSAASRLLQCGRKRPAAGPHCTPQFDPHFDGVLVQCTPHLLRRNAPCTRLESRAGRPWGRPHRRQPPLAPSGNSTPELPQGTVPFFPPAARVGVHTGPNGLNLYHIRDTPS